MSGKSLIEYGHVRDSFNLASMRKTLLGALYGIRVAEGKIELSTTLGELEIDDTAPHLTQKEKQATIEDLLKLRSGVYHVANYEGSAAKRDRPERGSHDHGAHYYYNNWDANALGTIYRQITGVSIFDDFKDLIADRIGMSDFAVADCEYNPPDENSIHPAYVFRMNPIDLEKFLQLYLQKGNWKGRQIIPAEWIERSLRSYSTVPSNGNGLGYFWEVTGDGKLYGIDVGEGAFAFSGYPGHYMVGIPTQEKALVHALSYDTPGKETLPTEKFAQLLQLVSRL
jgi:CubicO group peptidase (beta-lactamase class C family)